LGLGDSDCGRLTALPPWWRLALEGFLAWVGKRRAGVGVGRASFFSISYSHWVLSDFSYLLCLVCVTGMLASPFRHRMDGDTELPFLMTLMAGLSYYGSHPL
jgi:hypothetical protein